MHVYWSLNRVSADVGMSVVLKVGIFNCFEFDFATVVLSISFCVALVLFSL